MTSHLDARRLCSWLAVGALAIWMSFAAAPPLGAASIDHQVDQVSHQLVTSSCGQSSPASVSLLVVEKMPPEEVKGSWSTDANDCNQDPSKGITVLTVSDGELSFYEIDCDIQKARLTESGVRIDLQCVKGGGARGSGYVNLTRVGPRRLHAYFSPIGNFAQGWSATFTRCGVEPDDSQTVTHWNHNGSVMYLMAQGTARRFFYESPRAGMWEVGVRPKALLFEGESVGNAYRGTAYIFNRKCGAFPYPVAGPILDGGRRVLLTGRAPRIDNDCRISGHIQDELTFELIE